VIWEGQLGIVSRVAPQSPSASSSSSNFNYAHSQRDHEVLGVSFGQRAPAPARSATSSGHQVQDPHAPQRIESY